MVKLKTTAVGSIVLSIISQRNGIAQILNINLLSFPKDDHKILIQNINLHLRAEEVFVMLTLNSQDQIMEFLEVSVGSIDKNIVTPLQIGLFEVNFYN